MWSSPVPLAFGWIIVTLLPLRAEMPPTHGSQGI